MTLWCNWSSDRFSLLYCDVHQSEMDYQKEKMYGGDLVQSIFRWWEWGRSECEFAVHWKKRDRMVKWMKWLEKSTRKKSVPLPKDMTFELKKEFTQKWKFCHHLLKLFQTSMSFFLLLNTKGDISRNVGNQTVSGPCWLPYYFCPHHWSQQHTFCKISYFMFNRRKKIIQVWNNLRVSKWWQNFHFWVNYLFKMNSKEALLSHNGCCAKQLANNLNLQNC